MQNMSGCVFVHMSVSVPTGAGWGPECSVIAPRLAFTWKHLGDDLQPHLTLASLPCPMCAAVAAPWPLPTHCPLAT